MSEPARFDTPGLRFDMPGLVWDGPNPLTNTPLTNPMSLPNVAVAFPQTKRDEIAAAVAALKMLFPVMGVVGPEERKKLQNVAEGREAIVGEAFTDAEANPATVPGTIDMGTWALVEEQFDGLDAAESLLVGLLDELRGVKAVAGDIRYSNVLRYRDYLESNVDVLPGAKPILDKIAVLFQKQGQRKPKVNP